LDAYYVACETTSYSIFPEFAIRLFLSFSGDEDSKFWEYGIASGFTGYIVCIQLAGNNGSTSQQQARQPVEKR